MTDHRERWWPSPTVELGKVVDLALEEPFVAGHGGALPEIQVSYEAWGALNAARDNAVLVAHPLTADCHATGEFAGQDAGWWEPLIGPGRPIDTERCFVVCPNLIGGCYGTTGPRFPAPDGEPWYERFPLLTPLDMMRVQRLFLERLGIRHLRLVIGPSLGGMIAWEWAIEAPGMVDRVAVIAAPLRSGPHQIGLNWLQRRGIELDLSANEVVASWGQMVARGVGMLSYRSPVGLDEKFGRTWFKEPGATLAERGMFNVESWLRHHGRRIAKRFDPFTYLLFSRAMDLHDVSRGRDDLAAELRGADTSVLVVGISSDALYPPDEVRAGADLLQHLGGAVRYREIRSPNGHDAFLLDTDAIGGFLREWDEKRAPDAPAGAERVVRIGLLGAGRVAASLLRLIEERRDPVASEHRLRFEVAAVAEIDRNKTLDPVFGDVEIHYDPAALVARRDLDAVVDLTRGPGSRALVEAALRRRLPVVTPNKVLLRTAGDALDRLAHENGVRLAYHDSIAAGWPLIHALERPLARGRVVEIQAMVSSACNVMLERAEAGASWEEALAEAEALDLTEPDPEIDLSGWDSMEKLLLLLARATGRRVLGRETKALDLRSVDPDLVRKAPDLGFRIKMVAVAAGIQGAPAVAVGPAAVRAENHLGLVHGASHVVVVHTADGGELVHLGSGEGALPVATAVLNDLVGVFDPAHSWTGRFPAAEKPVGPLRFRRRLALVRGKPAILKDEGIPIVETQGDDT